ncbi:MAG: hypothetical protein F4Y45_14805 [Acidobacteria bacterium]|nr:hypothetical protein [Acidobacteriota bacterium]MYJ04074.1 hypothetical protein [Acidobacteriota bacterium]
MNHGRTVALHRAGALLVAMLSASVSGAAAASLQQPGGGDNGPAVEVVHTVGCAERRGGDADWWLVRAAEPEPTGVGVFNVLEVDAAKSRPLGDREFQLIGVPDFLGAEALLRAADRALFTEPDQVNATGELRDGRAVLVKALLIDAEPPPRLNLLAVVGLADNCGTD